MTERIQMGPKWKKRAMRWCEHILWVFLYVSTTFCIVFYFVSDSVPANNTFEISETMLNLFRFAMAPILSFHYTFIIPKFANQIVNFIAYCYSKITRSGVL